MCKSTIGLTYVLSNPAMAMLGMVMVGYSKTARRPHEGVAHHGRSASLQRRFRNRDITVPGGPDTVPGGPESKRTPLQRSVR